MIIMTQGLKAQWLIFRKMRKKVQMCEKCPDFIKYSWRDAMAKPNRSVLRSKSMLRKAYIELSTEKDASKITVVDVVNRADLSRNTFYAHYPDVNAIAEEIENEFIQKFNLYLDQTLFSQKLNHPLPLLRRFEQFIRSDEEDCRMLVYTQNYPVFLEKLKKLFIDRLVANIDDEPIRDKYGFLVFVHVLVSGLIELYTLYLKSEIDLSLAQINEEINKMFLAGIPLYQ